MDRIKTIVLLALLSGLFLLMGQLIGGHSGLQIALIMALFMNGIMYFFSDKIILRMYQAQPLERDQYKQVYEIVEELAHIMRIPMPKLWIIRTPMANAFATGRSPSHASVAVTTGIVNILDYHELRGVLAHELSHIKNRDILVTTIAATIATAIGYLANMLHHIAFWSSVSSRNKKEGNPLAMILIAIIMPIAGAIVQLAISRSREYLADDTGARACHDPLALASALEKLHSHVHVAHLNPYDETKVATASLFIVNPFSAKNIISLFSTHPPAEKRIARLRNLFEKRNR